MYDDPRPPATDDPTNPSEPSIQPPPPPGGDVYPIDDPMPTPNPGEMPSIDEPPPPTNPDTSPGTGPMVDPSPTEMPTDPMRDPEPML
jgi:hypothetical protein